MPVMRDTLRQQLATDLALACTDLAHARLLLRLKDSEPHRAAVAEEVRRIDALLDMFLQVDAGSAREPNARPAPVARAGRLRAAG